MKLLAVNGSPRKAWNTASLLAEVVKGAESAGAEAELVHLRDLGPYKGCISCFHCKDPKGKSYGRCIVKDELKPLLDTAHEADVLVFGTPVYFGAETGLMRNFLERMWFQYYLYSKTKPSLSPEKKATALLYTMNIREENLAARGYDRLFATAQEFMGKILAPCEVFLCTNTKQFNDYSRYETDLFDVPAKLKRHEEIFPQELQRAFALGKRLVS